MLNLDSSRHLASMVATREEDKGQGARGKGQCRGKKTLGFFAGSAHGRTPVDSFLVCGSSTVA